MKEDERGVMLDGSCGGGQKELSMDLHAISRAEDHLLGLDERSGGEVRGSGFRREITRFSVGEAKRGVSLLVVSGFEECKRGTVRQRHGRPLDVVAAGDGLGR